MIEKELKYLHQTLEDQISYMEFLVGKLKIVATTKKYYRGESLSNLAKELDVTLAKLTILEKVKNGS